MQEVIRVPKPIIKIENSDYEIRWNSSYYGIGHYAKESSKSRKRIIQKLKENLKSRYNRKSRFVIIKLIATGHCETEIKNYEKLLKYKFAVFDTNSDGSVDYYGVVSGVDRTDALNQLSTSWPIRKNRLHLLKIENAKIPRNRFFNSKVIDRTVKIETFPKIEGTQKVLYDKIKGAPIKNKVEDGVINEDDLY